ncbi:hypothetical protein [Arthrobacter cryoconiti]|uniref:Lipoprotein n=1 Tax=Arthrobacter cryoconiti TaxID=748907 RepID=A0ABV8R4G8_9MICC|nr:hypothetical protein [Arthrobacter cryoconiti]MCC9068037.1 hypothetical protein [Arthrobacter cryoconiti]
MVKFRFLSLFVTLLASLALEGCATPVMCPAIGWINTIDVNLTGNVADIASLELCVDGVCAASSTVQQIPVESLRRATLVPTGPASAPTGLTTVPLNFSINRIDQRTWRASMSMAAPATLTLRALSSAHNVLVEREIALEWRRMGGSEQCGGPSEVGPITLDIPL